MSSNFVFVLGASDPEMAAIESLLQSAGVRFAYALAGGVRVHPGNAYKADGFEPPLSVSHEDAIVFVECDLPGWFSGDPQPRIVRCDHHRPGDPGYGLPPERYLEGSSIGQVISLLAEHHRLPQWEPAGENDGPAGQFGSRGGEHYVLDGDVGAIIPRDIMLVAAADHCLEAAYRGKCPGVNPDELMRWRAESRAAFQRRPWTCSRCGQTRDESEHGRTYNLSVDDAESIGGQGPCGDHHIWLSPVDGIMADIEAARERLREAVDAGCQECNGTGYHCSHHEVAEYADLRGEDIPELPEAAAREGIPFLSQVKDRGGREKVVLMAAPPELVSRFLAGEVVPGLVDMYGDPARGFAGGYVS